MKGRKRYAAWAFLLPNLLGVAVFALFPMLEVLFGAFRSGVGGRWVGLQNFRTVLENRAFRLAARNTGEFMLVCIPLLLMLSLLLGVNWMGSGASFWVLIISYLWKNLGYTVVLWTAALGAIPGSIYEAAQIDGANSLQCFLHMTLPNLKTGAYSIAVLSLLNSFKVFREAWLVAGDYPQERMYLVQHLYNNWFRELDYDKIAAASVLVSCVVLGLIALLGRGWDREGQT